MDESRLAKFSVVNVTQLDSVIRFALDL